VTEGLGLSGLEVLFEVPGLAAFDLPAALETAYGGPLGFDEPRVIANFVATLDGVVAIPSRPSSNKIVAGASLADRFVLGLLRACADVLVVGSGTMLASPRSLWTAAQGFPAAAGEFAELRRRLGRPPELQVAIISGSGFVDPDHPAFLAGAIVLTTESGAKRLEGTLPAEAIVNLGDTVDPVRALAELRARGHALVLSEGGPTSIGPWLEARLIDELFLTVSPLLVGRVEDDPRLGLVEGADLLPGGPLEARLLGVRRDGGHLFLRYEIDTSLRGNRGSEPLRAE
jgi:riboflavin biosynthesis pyrimidine reductase